MRAPTGYATVTAPDQALVERDTATCAHCQRVIFVKPGTASTVYLIFSRVTRRWEEEAGAYCAHCMRAVCLACHEDGRCRPWEDRLAHLEARARRQGAR